MEMQIEKCPNYGWVELGLYKGLLNPQNSGDLRDKIRIRVICGITARLRQGTKKLITETNTFCSDGLLSVG